MIELDPAFGGIDLGHFALTAMARSRRPSRRPLSGMSLIRVAVLLRLASESSRN